MYVMCCSTNLWMLKTWPVSIQGLASLRLFRLVFHRASPALVESLVAKMPPKGATALSNPKVSLAPSQWGAGAWQCGISFSIDWFTLELGFLAKSNYLIHFRHTVKYCIWRWLEMHGNITRSHKSGMNLPGLSWILSQSGSTQRSWCGEFIENGHGLKLREPRRCGFGVFNHVWSL